jgi:hypothetical protein
MYKAWLSAGTGTDSAASRLRHHPGRYVRTDGINVALGWDELTSGALFAPITRTEFGDNPNHHSAWTGTFVDGTWTGRSCNRWQSDTVAFEGTFGAWATSSSWWSYHEVLPGEPNPYECDSAYGLYCFQQS